MMAYCDFDTQVSMKTDNGSLRPDMIVNLPAGKCIVVDAKAPLDAYLNAVEAPDEISRDRYLADHARHIREHTKKLGAKNYWDNFKQAPEFVVLFLPGENFFSAALQVEPDLIQQGIADRVILATPTTLIALLKAVAYGWRNEQLAENAQQISDLGKELYERLATMTDHLSKLGSSLKQAVNKYNDTIGSLETRVLPSARKFQELGVAVKDELKELTDIDQTPRGLHAPELTEAVARKQLGVGLEESTREHEEKEATENTEGTEN
jgi:DNA recombination protein RmuC